MAKLVTVTICNGTGTSMTLVDSNSWHGQPVGGKYPAEIKNGMANAVTFKNVPDLVGSMAGLVYRDGNEKYDYILAWFNPLQPIPPDHKNSVWAETREKGTYNWGDIKANIAKTCPHHNKTWNGFVSDITITDGIPATVEASFTLEVPDNASSDPNQVGSY